MKGFIAATTTTAFLCLTLFILVLANDHEWRSPDAAIHSDEDDKDDNHRSLQVTAAVTKDSVDPKLGSELTQLFQDYILRTNSSSDGPRNKDEYVAVDIAFKRILDKESAKKVLLPAFTVDFIECFQYMCSVRVPVRALKDISNIDAVQVVHSAQAMTQTGSITSEGDKSMYADVARTTYSVNGNGLMIGVISDSYNCLDGAAADIASGDLPSGASDIIILREYCLTTAIDEGRAMMQLIYDVAPGARLAFRTAYGGQASFASGILALAAAGCDVIVDDIINFAEPMFQDGIIAQAANQVVAQGIPYFSAAGNAARRSWDAPSGFIPVTIRGRVFHRFGTDSSGNPITRMRITMPGNGVQRVIPFQWDQPFKSVSGTVGAQSDIDIYLYQNGRRVAQSINKNIVGGDPLEEIKVTPSGASLVTYELEIRRFAGPSPTYMKLIVYGGRVTFEFPTNLGTSSGHQNTALAAGVGAAFFLNTPAFGIDPPQIEPFSSAGGVPIFFAIDGSRLSSPEIRNQPRFTGPDGGATTFFGQQDSSGIWRFYGTSASAPHVAAVAALMLQFRGGRRSLTPAEIYATLEATAVDMDDPFTPGFDVGFDFGTGHGLVNAQAAMQALLPPTPATAPIDAPVTAPIVPPTPVTAPVVNCTLFFVLFNANTDALVVTLSNNVTIANPPPCGQTNIEAVVPCGDSDDTVTIELYQGGSSNRIRQYTDAGYPYFLFGNRGSNVQRGQIPAGSYGIRAQVNDVWSPLTNFTLGGTCS